MAMVMESCVNRVEQRKFPTHRLNVGIEIGTFLKVRINSTRGYQTCFVPSFSDGLSVILLAMTEPVSRVLSAIQYDSPVSGKTPLDDFLFSS